MIYKDIIDTLTPFEYSKYCKITSYEKLMIYAAFVLEEKHVPLTFNYICIASFKLFPEKFCCDEEFKEFPSVDRLNRTLMHLKYVKNGRPFLTGSIESGYSLTNYGIANAMAIRSIISNANEDDAVLPPPIVDKHKAGASNDYYKLKESEEYKKYLNTGDLNRMFVWSFYKAIPFTQIKGIKEKLSAAKKYAQDKNDTRCAEFIEKVLTECF